MEENTIQNKPNLMVIDIHMIVKNIILKRKLFLKVLLLTFVLSSLFIICIPRYYSSTVKLAPELSSGSSSGTLSSLASSFGLNLGGSDMLSSDAISPSLYPDVLSSTNFLIELFPIRIATNEGDVKTDYYTYLDKYQIYAWWHYPIKWFLDLIISQEDNNKSNVNPFKLTRKQSDIIETMCRNINCEVDKKTDVIIITVTDQDKLVCATIADSVRAKLQNYITRYRTNKTRLDLEYYKKLTQDAKVEYERARQKYAAYSDANMDLMLTSYKARMEDLENDMQLKYNTYNALNTQLQAAKAKVQERTPAFTILQGATVPIKPAGPKRMIFVIVMELLAFIATTIYVTKKNN